jgi:hypothetical protein
MLDGIPFPVHLPLPALPGIPDPSELAVAQMTKCPECDCILLGVSRSPRVREVGILTMQHVRIIINDDTIALG